MKPYKLLIPFLFFLLFFRNSTANEFEGNLIITEETFYDTTYYYFSVRNNLVRMDQKNSQKQIIQSLIIDLDQEKITALSPNHKLYTNIQTNNKSFFNKNEIVVMPTHNFKIINGYKCYLWRVRNEPMNSEVSYWIYDSGYSFFDKTIALLSGTEDYSNLFKAYIQINNTCGLPILSVERTLLREEKSKITVTNFTGRKVNPKLFEIPEGYKYLRY
jgi:hypothetical protein